MPQTAPRIIITGFGLVTPLGHGAWQTFRALLAGRSITDRCAGLPADIGPVGLVRAIGGVSIARHTGDDPTVELAERAAREALTMADAHAARTPCFIGTSKGAFQLFDHAAARFAAADRSASALTRPQLNSVTMGAPGYFAQRLSVRLGAPVAHHSVAACASSLVALHHARMALLRGRTDGNRAMVVTADAGLTPMLIHAYHRLGVLAPLSPDAYRCAPLDADRRGFVLSEAGAAVVLERVDASAHPPAGAVELADSAEGCDAFDLVRTDPGMPSLRRIARRLLAARDVDLIHPHAPGTPDHDDRELCVYLDESSRAGGQRRGPWPHRSAGAASEPEFAAPSAAAALAVANAGNGGAAADFYASKGALGHCLGAAGLSALVIACLCAATQRRPPMPWLMRRHTPAIVRPEPPPDRRIDTQAVFAAGFGGHCAAALLQTL